MPNPAPRRGLLWRNEAAAALEFALVAPVLLVMIVGMVCLGCYFVFFHEVQELAAGAVRASVSGINATERDLLARQFVASAAANSGILQSADLTVNTATSGTPAIYFSVTVDYSLRDTPIPMLATLINVSTTDIVQTSTIQFGNY